LHIEPGLLITFLLVAITAFAALWARRWNVPHAILLVLMGLWLSFLPWMPRLELDPT
jgi:hypothetical protein